MLFVLSCNLLYFLSNKCWIFPHIVHINVFYILVKSYMVLHLVVIHLTSPLWMNCFQNFFCIQQSKHTYMYIFAQLNILL